MNGGDMQRIREELGVGRTEFARAMGFEGANLSRRITRLEMGKFPITDNMARRALYLQRRWREKFGERP